MNTKDLVMPPNEASPTHRLGRVGVIVVVFCTMLTTLMQALDSTIANVALPYMQGAMGASQDEINWVLTSYIVSAAIMTAPTGFLASRFGRTRLFVISIAGFTIASILCGVAQSLAQIVLFRILQGIFGASLVPLSQSVLLEMFPGKRRGPAMALWGLGVQIGPVLGPILGGWLTGSYTWRWIFFINVPLGIIATVGIITGLTETQRNAKLRIDWLGFIALSVAIGALQIMLDRGEQKDWLSSPEIVVEACIAGIGIYIFVVQSVLVPRPFLSLKLFTDLNFGVGLILIFIVAMTLFATMALLAPFLQNLIGYPVITAGISLAPRGFGTMAAMILAGNLVSKIGARPLVTVGFLCSAYSLYQMAHWSQDVSEGSIILAGLIQGISVGLVFVPVSTTAFATLPAALRTEATGVLSLMRNLGSSIGISITGALLETDTQINHADIAGVITPFHRALQSGPASLYWNPTSAAGAAAINQEVTRQASFIAYSDDFKLMFILSLAVLPLILFMRSPKVERAREEPRR